MKRIESCNLRKSILNITSLSSFKEGSIYFIFTFLLLHLSCSIYSKIIQCKEVSKIYIKFNFKIEHYVNI
jgi:hypothetical protein